MDDADFLSDFMNEMNDCDWGWVLIYNLYFTKNYKVKGHKDIYEICKYLKQQISHKLSGNTIKSFPLFIDLNLW